MVTLHSNNTTLGKTWCSRSWEGCVRKSEKDAQNSEEQRSILGKEGIHKEATKTEKGGWERLLSSAPSLHNSTRECSAETVLSTPPSHQHLHSTAKSLSSTIHNILLLIHCLMGRMLKASEKLTCIHSHSSLLGQLRHPEPSGPELNTRPVYPMALPAST